MKNFTSFFPPPYFASKSRIMSKSGASFIIKGNRLTYRQDELAVADLAGMLNAQSDMLTEIKDLQDTIKKIHQAHRASSKSMMRDVLESLPSIISTFDVPRK